MKKLFFVAFIALFAQATTFAQSGKLMTRDGKVYFNATSESSPEKIEAAHNAGTFVLDQATGNLQMAVLIKGFYFESALMQEHFNENYMESGKFPKSTFSGKLDNLAEVDFTKDGTYKTTVSGSMELHGVKQKVSTPVVFTIKSGVVSAACNFAVALKDYKVDIPSLVADKVAKVANISIAVDLKPM
jgi:type 1 fimbria pilin